MEPTPDDDAPNVPFTLLLVPDVQTQEEFESTVNNDSQPVEATPDPVKKSDLPDTKTAKSRDTETAESTASKNVYSFQPIAPVPTQRRSETQQSDLRSTAGSSALALAAPIDGDARTSKPSPDPATDAAHAVAEATTLAHVGAPVSVIGPALAPPIPAAGFATLPGSLNRVLAAFRKDAVAAEKAMGPGAPGEIVNAFLWVSRDASKAGNDKAQYTRDWLIFTEFRLCFGRKTRFLRKAEHRVYSKNQVLSVDVNVASAADPKDPMQPPYTFVSMKFNLVDGTSIVRHIYVESTELRDSPELRLIRDRLSRLATLGWPLVEGPTWASLPASEATADD